MHGSSRFKVQVMKAIVAHRMRMVRQMKAGRAKAAALKKLINLRKIVNILGKHVKRT